MTQTFNQFPASSFPYDSYDSMDRLLDYQRGVLASGGGSITTAITLPRGMTRGRSWFSSS